MGPANSFGTTAFAVEQGSSATSASISRRNFLAASSAWAVAPLASMASGASSPDSDTTLHFAFFSDSHGSPRRNADVNRPLLQEIRSKIRPAFAINAGDLTEHGWESEYAVYAAMVKEWGIPVHNAPGNHDVRWSPMGMTVFRKYLGPEYSSFESHGCHFFVLDSSVPLSHWGHIEKTQLRWLKAGLKKAGRDTPVFLAMHHPVAREGCSIDNDSDLYDVIEPFNVKLLLTGHGHNDLLWDWNGLACTMNKGLYQGSYESIEVSFDAGEVRLSRRTSESVNGVSIAVIPIAADKEKRPIWRIPTPTVKQGDGLRIETAGPLEYCWRKGEWRKTRDGKLDTKDLAPGYHRLQLRRPGSKRGQTNDVRIDSKQPGFQVRWTADLSGGVMSHLLLVDDDLFVSTMDGAVYRIGADTGKEHWRVETGGYCHSSPRLAGRLVVVGSADNCLYGLDRSSGKPRWRFKTDGPVYASAAIGTDVAAIASGDGRVYGVDLARGKQRWRFSLPKSNTAFSQSVAASDGQRAFVGAWDNHVYAIDLQSGKLAWRVPCCKEKGFAYSPAISSPAVALDKVFIAANGNRLFCLDAATGQEAWSVSSPGDKFGYSSPSVVDGRVYIGCLGGRGQVRCLEALTGKELWCADTRRVIYDSSPAVADGCVCIGACDGGLSVIDASKGNVLGQFNMPSGLFVSSPAAQNGRVFAATYSNKLIAVTLPRGDRPERS
jgi:outer membrane protein assembly factor BamB